MSQFGTAAVTIVDVPPPKTLSSVAVTCPATVNEGNTGSCSATAKFSDNSTATVTSSTNWSVSPAYATISSAGVLTAAQVTANQAVTVKGSYSYNGGVSQFGTAAVTIKDVPPNDDHGNTIQTATKVLRSSTTAGKIEVAGDVDVFRIDTISAGSLSVSTTGNTDTYGYLLDSNGQELATNDNIPDPIKKDVNKNFGIVRVVPIGTYYVKVRHALQNGTGDYSLVVSFSTLTTPPESAVILLHGLNSDPNNAWDSIVSSRWSGNCPIIYGGLVSYSDSIPSGKEACYRVRFGSLDFSDGLNGIEGVSCPSATLGCKGDHTRISSGSKDLGKEVLDAIAAVQARLGDKTKIVLLGHSRGGLAARSALQRSIATKEISAVIGLITTGTPHEGSPFGKVYQYLNDNCPRPGGDTAKLSAGDCKTDWTAADKILSADAKLDLRRPAITFLAPLSDDMKSLMAASGISNLKSRNIKINKIVYDGEPLGHLAKDAAAYFDYYAWGSFYAFSARSKKWVLCDNLKTCSKRESDSEFLGDGIVPKASQSATSIGGNLDTISNKGVIHVEETNQARVSDITKALSTIY